MIVLDRGRLHGEHGPIFRPVHPGGILREMCPLPGRHQKAPRDPRPDHQGTGPGRRYRTARKAEPRASRPLSLCGLGQTAPNPMLSTIRYFREEFEAHIRDKKCPAKVCKALLTYSIDENACKACGACLQGMPAGAITGEKKMPHKIDPGQVHQMRVLFRGLQVQIGMREGVGPKWLHRSRDHKRKSKLQHRNPANKPITDCLTKLCALCASVAMHLTTRYHGIAHHQQ